MNNLLTGLLAAVLIISSTSCGIFRKGAGKARNNDTTMVVHGDTVIYRGTVSNQVTGDSSSTGNINSGTNDPSMVNALLPLWNKTTTYRTFNAKAKVHLETPKDKNDFTATIRMEKDKRVWVSIVALGVFEAARALITPDTIIVLDRSHKEVTILPFKDAGKLLPVAVEFSTLQSLIIGDVLRATNDGPTGANATGQLLSLILKATKYDQQLDYNKGDSSIARQEVKVKNDNGTETQLAMQYSDYDMIDNRKFAKGRVLNIQDVKGTTKIEMDFVKVEFDQALEYNFSVPDRYERK